MTSRPLVFAPEPEAPTPTYSLLSLPPSLVALLSDPETAHSLEIRGHTTDAAVLVSGTKTYSLRGVQNSNSLCLCSLPDSGPEGKGWFAREQDDDECEVKDGAIEIQTVLHETLEVVQGVARTDRLEGLLRGSEYRGEDGEQSNTLPDSKQTSTTLKSLLPASDTEISTALRRHRVITLDGYLRPLPPSYLLTILPSLLSAISPAKAEDAEEESMPEAQPRHDVKPGFSKKDRKKAKAAPAAAEAVKETLVTADSDDLLSALDAVDCGEEVARQLLAWFGKEQKGDRWELRVREVVRETGIGLLEEGGYGQQKLAPFLERWKQLCSGFSSLCSLPLLANTAIITTSTPATILFLPASALSATPSDRFAHLFALRPRWKDTEMLPFLESLTGGDKKKLDAVVLKFVRKVKVPDGWEWTSRNQF